MTKLSKALLVIIVGETIVFCQVAVNILILHGEGSAILLLTPLWALLYYLTARIGTNLIT